VLKFTKDSPDRVKRLEADDETIREERRASLEKALEAGTKYTITGVERFFVLDNGRRGLMICTTAGIRRTTSKIVMAQLTDKKTVFPIVAKLVREKSKPTGKPYEFLKEVDDR